jgi:general secretion pathway protein I
MRTRAGFSLLEVMVATLIMAVAVVTLLSSLTTSLRNAARITDYDRAAMLAKHKMDELLLAPRLPMGQVIEGRFEPAQAPGLDASWRAQATIFEAPPNGAPGTEVLARIDLIVQYKNGERVRSLRIEGFRKRTLLPGDIP